MTANRGSTPKYGFIGAAIMTMLKRMAHDIERGRRTQRVGLQTELPPKELKGMKFCLRKFWNGRSNRSDKGNQRKAQERI